MHVILPSHFFRTARAWRGFPLLAASFTALAAWLSQGLIAFAGAGDGRFALLPLSVAALSLALLAGGLAWWAIKHGASASPLLLLVFLFLPSIPGPLPAILLLWTGPIVGLLWLASGLAVASTLPYRLPDIARPQVTAAALAFAIGAFSAWQVSPSIPGGDEPHYLIIAQSLLQDGDVRIENNHRQRDYRAYVNGDLAPDFRVRGRNGEIYSIHAPGVSALVAPAFAIGGYRGVVLFLLLIAAAGSGLAWHLAWLVTGREDAAWFGWAAVTLSATWIFHSFTVYPDGPGAVLALTALWAIIRAQHEAHSNEESIVPWILHGAALGVLPWMHTRFAAIAGLAGALVLLRLPAVRNSAAKACAFLCVPAVSGLAWLGYFIKIYGTPNPSAPYGNEINSLAFIPGGLAGLLIDQRFGLLAYAPVLLCAFAGVGVMLTRRSLRRYALELLFVVVPYLLVVTYVAMWWGGASAPARFFAPVLLWMAVPAAVCWKERPARAPRAVAIGSLAFTAFASAALVLVGGGRLAFNSRPVQGAYAVWLEWLNGSLDLGRGLPVWWREDESSLWSGLLIWAVAAVAGYFSLDALARHPRLSTRGRFATASAGACAVFAMAAITVSWQVEGVDGRAPTPGQLAALREVASVPRLLAFRLDTPRRISPQLVAASLRIEPPFSNVEGGAGRNDRPLFVLPSLPAGEYRLSFPLRAATGWLMIGIGRDQFALRTEPLAADSQPMRIAFPVDVRALIVRADEDARRSVRAFVLEPERILTPGERLRAPFARRAVRYATSTVFFTDDKSFPEPEAFWVGGARDSTVVLQPDQSRATETLLVRNGAAENQVLIETGSWRDGARLGPGEERRIEVPLDHRRGATVLKFTTSAGFRPSDSDPKSRDDRFLGVWVKVLD
jgi:hypothetical protein